MLRGELVVTIPGTPAPKGSLRCIARPGQPHRLIEDNKKTKPWRASVVGWLAKVDGEHVEKGQAVGAEVTFTVARPATHHRSKGGRLTSEVKPSAPAHPVTRSSSDVDKLLRLILDALQDGPRPLLPDDAQVVEVTARKAYPVADEGDPSDRLPYPGVRIRLYPL